MSEPSPKKLSSQLYLTFWRWHFWMGLLVAPVIIIASVTGSIYVFKEDLQRVMYPELMFTDGPTNQQQGFDAFEAAVSAHNPADELRFLNVSAEPGRAWLGYAEQHLEDGSEKVTQYYFDPATGELLGTLDNETSFFRVVLAIHRRLFAGTPGRVIVETATSWGIISILTGLWLWWPRKKEKIWGVWLPRIRGSTKTVLRDWHTVPGVYIALFALIIMVTGLLFTRVWGTAVRAGVFATGGFPEFFTDPPVSAIPDGDSDPQRISVDAAMATAFGHYDFARDGFSLGLPHDETDTFQIITDTHVPLADRGAVYLDQYSGETLVFETSKDIPMATHVLLAFYPIHVGSIFGLPTKILAVLACLILIAMSVTGIWLWWRRRPPGSFGAPREAPELKTPGWIVGITILLAIFLPTVGLTFLLLFAIGGIGKLTRRIRGPRAA